MMTNLEKLTETDILNIILYGIYRLTEDPEYAPLGELIYTLDKKNLYRLCSEFGGATIKIPTLEELKNTMLTLLIYQEVNAGKSFKEACSKYEVTDFDFVLKMYKVLNDILKDRDND